MAPDTRESRPSQQAGAATKGSMRGAGPTLPDQAKQLVEDAAQCHPELASWADGFIAGWDAAVSAEVRQRLDALAETIALHDQRPWVEAGQFSRQRRIAREIAEMEQRAADIRAELSRSQREWT